MFQSKHIRVSSDKDNIARMLFCSPGSVNTLSQDVLMNLSLAISTIEENSSLISGLIIESDKKDFIVGADINEFLTLFSQPKQDLESWLIEANNLFCRIEDLPFPTLSKIRGFALGGGCECVLATDFRIADSSANIGLPETKLGIFPGFGGCVRTPRLLGLDKALEIITRGSVLNAEQCLEIGLVDSVTQPDLLDAVCLTTLHQAINQQIDLKSLRLKKTSPMPIAGSEAEMSFIHAKSRVMAKTGRHYPAPLAAISAIEDGLSHDRNQALDYERKYFVDITQTPQATALTGLYLADQYVKKKSKHWLNIDKNHQSNSSDDNANTTNLAVIGAGIMGGAITYQAALSGLAVTMKDITQSGLDIGNQEITNKLVNLVKKHHLSVSEMANVLNRISPTLDNTELSQKQLVIEAVVENRELKLQVLAELEQVCNSNCVIASNTSTIPIDELAQTLKAPENFCGVHFFNPVERMPLIEIVKGAHTSNNTIAEAVNLSLKMGKTPIVVNDCAGFFVNRVLFPYLAGFSQLLSEGVSFERIDRVMTEKFGWPMGPALLIDVIGIDTVVHARQVMAHHYPERMPLQPNDILNQMYDHQLLGQKTSAGFYIHSKDKRGRPTKKVNQDVYTLRIKQEKQTTDNSISDSTIIERCMIPLLNEVVLCLEESIIDSPQEADLALVYGLGFPSFRGGPIRYLEQLGIDHHINRCLAYCQLGSIYRAPDTLQNKQRDRSGFFSSNTRSGEIL